MPHTLTELQELIMSPPVAGQLWIVDAAGTRNDMTDARRAELRERMKAGELDRILFEAVTFRAVYPNANYYRFRQEHLATLAASFANVPFLRDHNVHDLDSRAGTVIDSWLRNDELTQTIEITNPRDMAAFLEHRMDRFSIAWRWSQITCSVCSQDWLQSDCPHYPGRTYQLSANAPPALCELIFENPTARETSAVNDPGVPGTQITAILSAQKEQRQMSTLNPGTGLTAEPTPPERARADADEILRAQRDALSDLRQMSATRADTAAEEILAAQRSTLLDMRLAASGLPDELHSLVKDALKPGWRPADLDDAISGAKKAWARLEERRTVQGIMPHASGMLDGLDRITEAFSALVEGRRPTKGVEPLAGIREMYIRLSGDYNMTGLFYPDHVNLANVNSTTMANIVANVLNKAVMQAFQVYPRWWEPICRMENFSTLQTVRWIILGDVGELPTVNEGAAYTELTWDDKYESSAWVKKGGYLGLTLEAMDMDDVGRLRSAPQALAQSAWLTLGKLVSAVFTSAAGLGPTLIDTGTLFNATAVTTPGGHANLGTTALSTTTWNAAKLAMRKQVAVNSGERLGALTNPKYMIVPPDLENTALTILASENLPGGANNDINPDAEGDTRDARVAAARRRIVVCDLWTDTNNWAAAADPNLYPTIGIGYRFGQTPEIFSVASPTSGLMFTNDVLPIKVRWFTAVGPIDFRGLYKANVA